jgi:hypothetical protein
MPERAKAVAKRQAAADASSRIAPTLNPVGEEKTEISSELLALLLGLGFGLALPIRILATGAVDRGAENVAEAGTRIR